LEALKSTVHSLSAAIAKLEEKLSVVQLPPLQQQQPTNEFQPAKLPDQPVTSIAPQVPLADRKLTVYGLSENPLNTNREDRLQRDVENVLSVIPPTVKPIDDPIRSK